ncbi:LytTR family DNA-binding domain-containing protein [[Clostridium] innocuum]|nr:LytTR family DNA-binding domain-containing protein [[Clostridium] innocuum]MCR0577636.1 LytTR family DNA-binding domain-containing protein [[Clostridium] innocuum]
MSFTVLVVDDDIDFAESVKKDIQYMFPEHFIVDVMSDIQILNNINTANYDLYILDIEMPAIEGFDLAERLYNRNHDSMLMFLTTHQELSITGYEYRAFRFIVKDNYSKFLNKALYSALIELNKRYKYLDVRNEASVPVKILVKDIICAYTVKNYLMVETETGLYQARISLREFQDNNSLFPFASPNKGMLVNLAFISHIDFDKAIIHLNGHGNMPISRRKKKEFYTLYAKGIHNVYD